MTGAVIVAAVLAVVAVLLAISLLRSRAAASSAERRAEQARAEFERSQADATQARGEVESLRAQLAALATRPPAPVPSAGAAPSTVAGATASDPSPDSGLVAVPAAVIASEPANPEPANPEPANTQPSSTEPANPEAAPAIDAPTLSALWALTRIRQEWTSRQSAILSLAEEPPEGQWAAATLGEVLEEEVSRIREDTGTPGTLRTSLPYEPPAAQSVLLMTTLQALLDALSRHCQGYDLYVHEWERRLTAIIVCDGFDGPDRVAADATSVLSAIAPAGGELALDRDAKGRLRARLSLAVAAVA
jgi:type II secretory pathway pseudopilin PulG